MATQKTLAEQLPLTARTEIGEFVGRLLAVLELRFQAIERAVTKEDRTIEVIRQVAIERINSTITPIVENALEDLHSLGGMFKASISGTHTVQLGDFQVFVIDEEERHTFAALDWVAIRAKDNNEASMSGPIRYYSPETGELVVDVESITGSGTYTGWMANVSVPYDPAVEAQLYVSPNFTGNPTAPTPLLNDNDTSIATTAFVQQAIADMAETLPETLAALDQLAIALGNDPNFAVTTAAALEQRLRVDIPTQNLSPTQKDYGQTNLDVYSKAAVQAWSLSAHHTKAEIANFGYTTTVYVNSTFATKAYVDATFYTIPAANNLYNVLVNAINGRVDWATYNAFVANAGNYSTYAWVNQRITDNNTTQQNWTITYFTQPHQVDAKINANNTNYIAPNYVTYGHLGNNYYAASTVEARIQAYLASYWTAATTSGEIIYYYNASVNHTNAQYNNAINHANYVHGQANYHTNNFAREVAFSGYVELGVGWNQWNNLGVNNVFVQGLYLVQQGILYMSWRHIAYYVPNVGWVTAGAIS